MKVRSLHYDMKGMTPTPEYMLKLNRDIASFGYNYLLVEFEDRFPYRNYGFMIHPDAYTKAQLKALNTPELQVIPLLQCAGHLDYLLTYPEMKHLRMDNSIYQWDMGLPQVFDIWREMADEILEVYPDCEYFHIGADEVEMYHDGDFETYIAHIGKCADYLIARGKKVIIWDDVFRKHPLTGLTRSLFEKVIVQVWQYRDVNEEFVANMVHAGAEVWGASRVQFSGNFNGIGPQGLIRRNIDQWTAVNQKYDLQGHTGTLWGRVQSTTPVCSNIPAGMALIAYLGESLKTNRRPDYDRFCAGFAQWFGDPDLELKTILDSFGYDPDFAAKHLHPVPENNDIMEIWTFLNRIDAFYAYRDRCFYANWTMMKLYREGKITPKTTNNYLDGVRIIRERIPELRQEIRTTLGKYFTPAVLEEYNSERFDYILELNDLQEKDLRTCQELFRRNY